MFFRRLRGPWAIGVVAGLVATVLVGVGATQVVPEGKVEVFLEPAGVAGDDPFMTLESPDLRMGEAARLALSGGVTVRVGIEPGLYGGSGSDYLCDPQLIADFLAQDDDKAKAWASAAGIEADEIDADELAIVIDTALADCDAAGIVGAAITPFVLGRMAAATEGRSIPANLSLAENNARVAAEIATAIAAT